MAAARNDDEETSARKCEVVQETDTMAAARGNDGEAAIRKNDATAAASAIATEAIRSRAAKRGCGRTKQSGE